MKKLAVKITLLLVPFLICFAISERFARGVPNSYTFKKLNLEQKLPQIEILVLGNSHSYYGLNPDKFRQFTYNMANVSQSLFYDKEILLKYIKRMNRLRVVIIPISYFSLQNEATDGIEYWRCFNYKRYYEIPLPDNDFFNFVDLRNYSVCAMYGKDKCLNTLCKKHKSDLIKNISENGSFNVLSQANTLSDASGKKRVDYHHSIMKLDRVQYNLKILEEIAVLAKKHGIAVVLCSLPVSHSYSRWMEKKNLEVIESSMAFMRDSHGIKYVDYTKDNKFTTDCFVDPDHLNKAGADKISSLLAFEMNPFFSDSILRQVSGH